MVWQVEPVDQFAQWILTSTDNNGIDIQYLRVVTDGDMQTLVIDMTIVTAGHHANAFHGQASAVNPASGFT